MKHALAAIWSMFIHGNVRSDDKGGTEPNVSPATARDLLNGSRVADSFSLCRRLQRSKVTPMTTTHEPDTRTVAELRDGSG